MVLGVYISMHLLLIVQLSIVNKKDGVEGRDRTRDLWVSSPVRYRLSHWFFYIINTVVVLIQFLVIRKQITSQLFSYLHVFLLSVCCLRSHMPLYFRRNVNKSGRRGVVVKACSCVSVQEYYYRSSISCALEDLDIPSLVQNPDTHRRFRHPSTGSESGSGF